MQSVTALRRINVNSQTLWPLIADVRRIEQWHFNISRVDLLSSQPTGMGAARRCNFHDGSSVREDVVALDEGRLVRMKLSEYSVPMKHLELELALRPISTGATEATLTLRYVVKFGPLGWLLGATAVRRQLSAVAAKLLAGLDHHATTGQNVGRNFFAKAA